MVSAADPIEYIAKRYAEDLIMDAIEDAAQDRLYEYVGYKSGKDGLELSEAEAQNLRSKVYDLMVSADIKFN